MKTIKVRVIKEYPQLKDVLTLGEIVDLHTHFYDKDKFITKRKWKEGKEFLEKVQTEWKDNVKTWTITNSKGKIYSTDTIRNFIGYKTFDEYLEKL